MPDLVLTLACLVGAVSPLWLASARPRPGLRRRPRRKGLGDVPVAIAFDHPLLGPCCVQGTDREAIVWRRGSFLRGCSTAPALVVGATLAARFRCELRAVLRSGRADDILGNCDVARILDDLEARGHGRRVGE